MRFRTWPIAAVGLGALLLLVVMSLTTMSRRAQDIYAQLDHLNNHHREVEGKLRRLRSEFYLSGIFLRDYLLETERHRAMQHRQRLAEIRRTNVASLNELLALDWWDRNDKECIASLQAKLDDYWQAFDPMFHWSADEKHTRSASFLREEVLPKRQAVILIATEIENIHNANLIAQRTEAARRLAAFRDEFRRLLWQSLLFGLFVAVIAVVRLQVLERRAAGQRTFAQQAERQMRELSQQIVRTQEEERRKLSRELHDHVGQMLTALRMELGHIERLRGPASGPILEAVRESRQLVDTIVRAVRDLALGLRPSMLDDFGLQAALEWHVRDFSRRCDVPVDLQVDGDFDDLPDEQRTCVYRTVQEALTNCVRHSKAGRIAITITLAGLADILEVKIADDGVGIDPEKRARGLGLRGIEERAKELNGTLSVNSEPGRGTTLRLRLPLRDRVTEVALASAAG
jgi:signal transduction histidine kinase